MLRLSTNYQLRSLLTKFQNELINDLFDTLDFSDFDDVKSWVDKNLSYADQYELRVTKTYEDNLKNIYKFMDNEINKNLNSQAAKLLNVTNKKALEAINPIANQLLVDIKKEFKSSYIKNISGFTDLILAVELEKMLGNKTNSQIIYDLAKSSTNTLSYDYNGREYDIVSNTSNQFETKLREMDEAIVNLEIDTPTEDAYRLLYIKTFPDSREACTIAQGKVYWYSGDSSIIGKYVLDASNTKYRVYDWFADVENNPEIKFKEPDGLYGINCRHDPAIIFEENKTQTTPKYKASDVEKLRDIRAKISASQLRIRKLDDEIIALRAQKKVFKEEKDFVNYEETSQRQKEIQLARDEEYANSQELFDLWDKQYQKMI